MSDLTDAIRASVTDEWKSSSEIAASLGARACRVFIVLDSQYKYGLIEKKVVGRTSYWRLPQ